MKRRRKDEERRACRLVPKLRDALRIIGERFGNHPRTSQTQALYLWWKEKVILVISSQFLRRVTYEPTNHQRTRLYRRRLHFLADSLPRLSNSTFFYTPLRKISPRTLLKLHCAACDIEEDIATGLRCIFSSLLSAYHPPTLTLTILLQQHFYLFSNKSWKVSMSCDKGKKKGKKKKETALFHSSIFQQNKLVKSLID